MVSSKPQFGADGETSDQMEACLAQQTQIQMPELELHRPLGQRDDRITMLIDTSVELAYEVEQLKELLDYRTGQTKTDKLPDTCSLGPGPEKPEETQVSKEEGHIRCPG